MDEVVKERIVAAFPASCERDLRTVLPRIRSGELAPSAVDVGLVTVRGEPLRIPARLYFAEPDPVELDSLTEEQRLLVQCLFTRHHDGHVRERMIKRVLPQQTLWTAPFVVQLLGEYVVEIIDVIRAHLSPSDERVIAEFLVENPAFWSLTQRRVISYWSCYYRSEFPNRQRYPGTQLVALFEQWRLDFIGASRSPR